MVKLHVRADYMHSALCCSMPHAHPRQMPHIDCASLLDSTVLVYGYGMYVYRAETLLEILGALFSAIRMKWKFMCAYMKSAIFFYGPRKHQSGRPRLLHAAVFQHGKTCN